ncbi:MAG: hypothetical protein AAGL10_13680 [Pseudomonadota bacterium]
MALSAPAALLGQSEKNYGTVALPGETMLLTRVLTRDLRGGAHLRVSRTWHVDFEARGSGIAISGMQSSARVDAPPQLARMAALEEQRNTNDIFPILLSDSGIIVAAGSSIREGDLTEAIERAKAMIAQRPIPDDEKAQHRLFLSQLQRSGASLMDQMPPDLFFPAEEPVKSLQEISLPGGMRGEFEMAYEAFPHPGQPWLHRALREVVTRIGADERRAFEEWSLEGLQTGSR